MTEPIGKEAAPALAPVAPQVRIVTDLGDIVIELYPDKAPRSASAFLAEVSARSYDGGSFSRIVRADNDRGSPTIEVIQGVSADPAGLRANVEVESTADTGLRHENGTISLPRQDGGHGTAQSFFLCIGAQPALDEGGGRTVDGLGFAAFGRVVEGMDLARIIHGSPTLEDAQTEYLKGQVAAAPVVIHRMTVEGDASVAECASSIARK